MVFSSLRTQNLGLVLGHLSRLSFDVVSLSSSLMDDTDTEKESI